MSITEYTTSRKFETVTMRVLIDDFSLSNSAFGTNEAGQGVFFNGRLVEKVSIDIGVIVEAHVIPNYEDKREEIPWRAVRAVVVDTEHAAIYATPNPGVTSWNETQVDQTRIKEYLQGDVYGMTVSEIADHLSLAQGPVLRALGEDKNFASVPAYTWIGD